MGKHFETIVGDSILSDTSALDRNATLRIHELSYTHPNGGRLIISLSASAMKDEQGQLLAVVCVIRDITELRRAESELRSAHDALESKVKERTAELVYVNEKLHKENAERKLAEESLRETAQRLHLATASGQLGIWDWDINTGALVWDDRMLELYGVTQNSFRGRVEDWQDSVHRDDRVRVMEAVDAAVRGEKEYDVEFRIVRPDGAMRLIKAYGIVIRDAEHKAIRMIGLNYDITERRRLEQEVMKVEKLESIGLFAGGMAHDFNNLLQVIISSVYLARMRLDPGSKAYDYLTSAEKAGEEARELGRLLLTFSKAAEPFKQITHIENLIKESVGSSLSGTNIVSEFELQDALYPVEIDEEQIKQVFIGLINNSKKAMPEGGILRIKANNVELGERALLPVKEGKYLLISIEDQGVGIPEISLPRIFDPYFTTKEMGADKGKGLGLAVCHSIIKRHHGFITVESRVGVGSTFHVYIPAAEDGNGIL